MQLIEVGKEHIDIEINGIAYHLYGMFDLNCFCVFIDNITVISNEENPISMEERNNLANSIQNNGSPFIEKLISELRDSKIMFKSNYTDELNYDEKTNVAKIICNEWKYTKQNFTVSFYDKNMKIVCISE